MISVILFSLAWGSYLNSLGYRLVTPEKFFQPRSFCPNCSCQIAWYDNIPLISWIILQARCRSCKEPISWLYPFIEIITTISFFMIYAYIPYQDWLSYAIFFSALILSIRTDFQAMVISRFVTIYAIPLIWLAAFYKIIPIDLLQSLAGACFGYTLMWSIKKFALLITKKDSLGQGDLELLAFIGSFIGMFGCWITLSLGSMLGVICTGIWMLLSKKRFTHIAFGPYLCFASMIFIFYKNFFISYFFRL